MKFNLLADTNWESRVDKALDNISDLEYRRFFEKKDYGSSLDAFVVVFMCRDPYLNFKQRIRFSRKDRTIYMDIMLDFNQFVIISPDERERIMVEKMFSEIPPIIAKYKLPDFDLPRFEKDLRRIMSKIL